jgi:putative permease
MKQLALLTIVILLTMAVLVVAWQLRIVMLIFLFSLAVSATLEGPVVQLQKRGWSRRISMLVVYGLTYLFFFALIAAIFMPLLSEIDRLVEDLVSAYGSFLTRLITFSGPRITNVVAQLPTSEQLTTLLVGGGEDIDILRRVFGATQNIGILVGQLVLGIVLAIYWSADRTRFERLWLSLLPPEVRVRTRKVWRKIDADVGAYARSELLQMILAGALLALGYWLIGIEYPFILAFIAAVAWLIPLIGIVLVLAAVVMIGWVSGMTVMAIALAYTILVLAAMEFWVERRIYAPERYWGVVVVAVLLAMGDAFGLIGLLLAPPVAVAIQTVLDELLIPPNHVTPPAPVTDFSALQQRLETIRAAMAETEGAQTPRLLNLMERLEKLLEEVQQNGNAIATPEQQALVAGSKQNTNVTVVE